MKNILEIILKTILSVIIIAVAIPIAVMCINIILLIITVVIIFRILNYFHLVKNIDFIEDIESYIFIFLILPSALFYFIYYMFTNRIYL